MKNEISYFIILLMSVFSCSKPSTPEPAVIPQASIQDLSQMEGNAGTPALDLIVRLSSSTTNTVTVNYAILEGTAKQGEDYNLPATTSIIFQPGETDKRIPITLLADDVRESDENFSVVLTSATNGTVNTKAAIITILNDDTRIPMTDTGFDAPKSYAGYNLAWADEFNTTSLDNSVWSFQNGDGCPNVCGWGNNELEYYTSRDNNLFFQDGKLVIEARKESFAGKNYTSSKIVSEGKKTFKFGRIDIRAKLPKGKGIWPALWMMPQASVYGGWPRSGEIDIMENLGHDVTKVYGTIHFGPGPGSTSIGKNYTLSTGSFYDQFHVFSLEWKQDQIKWLVDGVAFGTATKADFGTNNYPFNEQFYIILNLAVGGNWPGSPDASTTFPQWFIVDYIRVYQEN